MAGKQLKDQDLENVTGGYEGNIPSGGITYQTYGMMALNRYYSAAQDTNDVVWVFQAGMVTEYSNENFVVNKSNNTWKSNGVGGHKVITDYNDFHNKYPYMLNIRP